MKLETKVRDAVDGVKQAQHEMDEGKHVDALDSLLAVRKLKVRGPASSHICYLMAVCSYDVTEDYLMASHSIEEALALDPLCPAYYESFGIIADHIRRALADLGRSPGDKSTQKLYEILVRNGETDTDSHLAMARSCSTSATCRARCGSCAR